MKKVMHLINSFSLAGAEKLVLDIVKNNPNNDVEYHICALAKGNSYNYFKTELETSNIHFHCFDKIPNKDRIKTLFKVRNYLKKEKIDIIHTHCQSPDFFGKVSSLFLNKKRFTTIHNSKGYSKRTESVLGKFTTKYIAISEKIRQYMISDLNIPVKKIELINNGIDISAFKPTIKDDYDKKNKFNIIMIGRIQKQKGYLEMVKAINELKNKTDNFRISILGSSEIDKEYAVKVKSLVSEYALEDYIEFLGIKKNVSEYLSNSDLFLMTSLHEGLPITLLEALYTKIPILATNVGGIPEIIKDKETGLLICNNTPEEVSRKILWAMNNYKTMLRYTKNCYNANYKKYDIRVVSKKYSELY